MNRPVALLLTLAEAEALVLMLAKHPSMWRVLAREMWVDHEDVGARLVEAHRAGVKITTQ